MDTTTPRTQLVFETEEFTKRFDVEKDHEVGPDDTLVTYYREGNEPQDEIRCTVDESDDFERETDKTLDSDTLPTELFDALLAYVRDGWNVYDEHEVLGRAGLPVKPCGLNADWAVPAWHLSAGKPNSTSGDYYLLDNENDTYSIVRRWYPKDDIVDDWTETVVEPTTLALAVAGYKAKALPND